MFYNLLFLLFKKNSETCVELLLFCLLIGPMQGEAKLIRITTSAPHLESILVLDFCGQR